VAFAEGDLSEEEVVLELSPLLSCRAPLPGERAGRATLLDEVLASGDDLVGEDRGVAAAVGMSRQGGCEEGLRRTRSDAAGLPRATLARWAS
jgi:hypothetical protein